MKKGIENVRVNNDFTNHVSLENYGLQHSHVANGAFVIVENCFAGLQNSL